MDRLITGIVVQTVELRQLPVRNVRFHVIEIRAYDDFVIKAIHVELAFRHPDRDG